ncbi:MAG: response regulator transcription factor, partial [Chloroflexi bacterium]|nr:response regulator transcription factor [Chloroflexota bacterium]
TCLLGIGSTLAVQGQFVLAVRLWGKAKVLYDSVNRTISDLRADAWVALALRIHLDYDQIVVTVLRTQLDEQSFTAAWNEGQAMALEQLLDVQAMVSVSRQPSIEPPQAQPVQHDASPVKLTQREREVLRLLAQGLTSAQIAEQLVIGQVTVNAHVRSIYNKLGVSSRSAATRYAMEHYLL